MTLPANFRPRVMTIGGLLISTATALGIIGTESLEGLWSDVEEHPYLAVGVLIGLLLVVVGNFEYLMSWLGFDSPKFTERLIREWLDDAGYKVQRNPSDLCHFRFMANDPQGRPLTIAMVKKEPTLIFIGTGLGIGGAALEKVKAFEPLTLTSLAMMLQVELARYGVGYEKLSPPFDQVGLSTRLVGGVSLSRYEFFEKVNFMRNAFILFQNLLLTSLSALEAHDMAEIQNPEIASGEEPVPVTA
jgi:hypothetical protein